MQLDWEKKGFSFQKDGPLDMRMDPSSDLTAADVVNTYSEEDLGKLFRDFGEERHWRRAAKAVVEEREKIPFSSTKQLAKCLGGALGFGSKRKLHPATLIFQALRIVVNRELEAIEKALPKALHLLCPKGRMGVMSFHSLEDRIVKFLFQGCTKIPSQNKYREKQVKVEFKLVNKKPLVANEAEVKTNRRARSAKLRFIEKREM